MEKKDLMYNDCINNEFEYAHNKGLTRGFDLGWSYKGRFDRQILMDEILQLKKNKPKGYLYKIKCLEKMLEKILNHPNNKENITINFW